MLRTRGTLVDAVAAVAVLAVCAQAARETGRPAWWEWALVAAVAAAVAVRRRLVLPAAAVALAASGAVLAGGVIPAYAAPGLCAAVALTQFPAGADLALSRSVPVLAAGLTGAAALGLLWPAAPLVATAVVAVPWLAGRLVRRRHDLAERAFTERAARAVTEERLRIARDMHDTVAHSLSMIAMKASVARHVAAVRPEESLAALEVIETAGREALVEMRRAVGLLRDGRDAGTAPDGDLRALAGRAEQAGVRVTMTLDGVPGLPDGIRLVVYRTVQEALTNIVRHAHATACTVDVRAGADAVTVRVTDDGTAAVPGHGHGHGLRGMRERIIAYGGSLRTGPHGGGGFAVDARIPYRQGQP
ncbi:sensor histidine kinase [Actinoplanes sp. DH11]|uniref:sensor histidine kinase n=1 Tax=Actinoplanes sp. DH11 TaxID=2857011 RepID=UPI001E37AA07|nr:sensor histidine kinase [Actinoplanes sp. DH11]